MPADGHLGRCRFDGLEDLRRLLRANPQPRVNGQVPRPGARRHHLRQASSFCQSGGRTSYGCRARWPRPGRLRQSGGAHGESSQPSRGHRCVAGPSGHQPSCQSHDGHAVPLHRRALRSRRVAASGAVAQRRRTGERHTLPGAGRDHAGLSARHSHLRLFRPLLFRAPGLDH